MKLFGIIGYPLKTSFSCKYFNEKFQKEGLDHVYEIFPLNEIEDFLFLLKSKSDLQGLNVTFPYKKLIIPMLDNLDKSAEEVGAVNVIKFEKDGSLTGYNSDAFGFEESFMPLVKSLSIKPEALIFGTGGSAMAVEYVLRKNNIDYNFVSRNPDKEIKNINTISYKNLATDGFGGAQILINTTPLGMSPDINACVDIPYNKIDSGFLAFDLIYSPEKTLFLQKCEAQQAQIKNGLDMLYLQAERSWEIWQTKS
jgi:shikimate dehydrogenase